MAKLKLAVIGQGRSRSRFVKKRKRIGRVSGV